MLRLGRFFDLHNLRAGDHVTIEKISEFEYRVGDFWQDSDWRNWRRRTYQPVAAALGASQRPYDLRHSFVSLLIHEGLSIVEIARQAGHSVQTCLSTYAHVIDEFDPADRDCAELAIRHAREHLREAV